MLKIFVMTRLFYTPNVYFRREFLNSKFLMKCPGYMQSIRIRITQAVFFPPVLGEGDTGIWSSTLRKKGDILVC